MITRLTGCHALVQFGCAVVAWAARAILARRSFRARSAAGSAGLCAFCLFLAASAWATLLISAGVGSGPGPNRSSRVRRLAALCKPERVLIPFVMRLGLLDFVFVTEAAAPVFGTGQGDCPATIRVFEQVFALGGTADLGVPVGGHWSRLLAQVDYYVRVGFASLCHWWLLDCGPRRGLGLGYGISLGYCSGFWSLAISSWSFCHQTVMG